MTPVLTGYNKKFAALGYGRLLKMGSNSTWNAVAWQRVVYGAFPHCLLTLLGPSVYSRSSDLSTGC